MTTTSTSILQPRVDAGPAYLSARPENVLWGRLPCAADRPRVTVDPGTELVVDTVSHEGLLEDQGSDPVAFFGSHGIREGEVLTDAIDVVRHGRRDPTTDGPHVVTGPIAVRGAVPGDLLAITLVAVEPRVPYGVISNRHGRGALPGEYPAGPDTVSVFSALDPADPRYALLDPWEGAPRPVRFPIRPFLGIMGVAAAGDERPHSVPPGPYGGNIDINLLTVGSTLYLPVQVPGALAYVGDPHFAQGDGEIALTALEASLRVRLRLGLVPAAQAERRFGPVRGPLAHAGEFWIPTGLDPDLNEAVRACARSCLDLLHHRWGMDRARALAYASAAVDFNISQGVDRVCGVHARIRAADLSGLEAADA